MSLLGDQLKSQAFSQASTGVANTTPATSSGLSPLKEAKNVLQSIARSGVALTGTALYSPVQTYNYFTGKDASVPTFQGTGLLSGVLGNKKFSLETIGNDYGATEAGLSPALIGVFGGVADIALGGKAKGLSQSLLKARTAIEAEELMIKAGFSQDIARAYAPKMAKIEDIKQIETGIRQATTLQTSTTKSTGLLGKQGVSPSKSVLPEELPPSSLTQQSSKRISSYPSTLTDTSLNLKRFAVDEDALARGARLSDDLVEMTSKKVGKTLSHKEVTDYAKSTGQLMNRAVGREQTLKWEAALKNTSDRLAKSLQSGTIDAEAIKDFMTIKQAATDTARKLESFKIGADPTQTSLANEILTELYKAGKSADEIIEATKGKDLNDARQAAEVYRQFVKPKISEWIDLIRYNSMLSSPLTHIINISANLANSLVVAPLEYTLRGTMDFIGTGGGLVRKRQYLAREGASYLSGYMKNVGKAFNEVAKVMQGKTSYTHLDIKGIPLASKGLAKGVEGVLSVPSRALEAMDRFFMALSEGGERAAIEARMKSGINVPLADLAAENAAKYRIFRQELMDEKQGAVLNAIDQLTIIVEQLRNSPSPIVSTIAKFTVPFLRTPMNIFKQGIEYSPLGFTTTLGAKNVTEQITKATLGTTVALAAASMLGSGRLTWSEPTSKTERDEWKAAGIQGYSIKLGDKWYAYAKLPPVIAFPFAMVANIDDLEKKGKLDQPTADIIISAIAANAKFFSEQSYVKNIGGLIEAASGDEYAVEQLISNYPQQLIPYRAFSSWIARLLDESERQIDSKADFIDKQMQIMMLQIPGVRELVGARLGPDGEPIPANNRLMNAISPIKTTQEVKEFVDYLEGKKRIRERKKEKAEANAAGRDKIQSVYDTAQMLKAEGRGEEANALVDELSPEDWEYYKQIRTSERADNTEELRILLEVSPKEAVEFLRSKSKDEQERLLKVMTDEEYEVYQKGKANQPEEVSKSDELVKLVALLTFAQTANAATTEADYQPTLTDILKEIPSETLKLLGGAAMETLEGLAIIGEAIDKLYGIPGRVITANTGSENVPEGFSRQVEEALKQSGVDPLLAGGAGLAAGIVEPAGLPAKGAKLVKGVDDLLAEARKYKSAEEFVKAQAIKNAKQYDDAAFTQYLNNTYDEFATKKASILESAKAIDPKIEDVRLGGSYGKGKPTPNSDIDLEFTYKGTPPENLYEKLAGQFSLGEGKADAGVVSNVSKSQLTDIWKQANKVDDTFKNFPDLSTKLLSRLEGKTTVSKQFIENLTNNADLKQPERDLFRELLKGEGDTVNVPDFANKVKSELLPLERTGARDIFSTSKGEPSGRYEQVTLPTELRGPVANYSEHIYNSPIKTSAGEVHFGQPKDKVENYFAHTRIEDLPDNTTRRVIEAQSDLFQKGRLEGELNNDMHLRKGVGETTPRQSELTAQRQKELAPLEPYRNTWHERVIREEVKQAAKDGKTKLQFPTGETAMKIEGLGDSRGFNALHSDPDLGSWSSKLNAEDMRVGQEVAQEGVNPGAGDTWIITDVLGDGKFKAVPKYYVELEVKNNKALLDKYGDDYAKAAQEVQEAFTGRSETFDISGKVDTNNPIYKFYEKEVGRYLKNKYQAQLVTDAQGVKWWEVGVDKAKGKLPVEAFGALGIPAAGLTQLNQKENKMTAEELVKKIGPENIKSSVDATELIDVFPTTEKVQKIVKAIKMNESRGEKQPYSFRQPSSKDNKYGDALGAYQVTEEILKQHSKRYLGKQVTAEEFLNSPELQDKFMINRTKYLLLKGYTPEQIADNHRHGSTTEPGSTEVNRPEYVKQFLEHMK